MYLEFHKLTVKPFDITTNPNFLWLGEKHREALATLRYGIQSNMGFLLLTGGVGTGKTTLIYSLLNELGPEVAVANVPDPGLSPLDFYNYIAAAFGIEREFTTKGAFLAAFAGFLHDAHQQGKKILLIIDESQHISDKLLEEIRLLSNIERQETKLINIFFVGQIEFNTVLNRYQNRALRQRITVNYHIDPFTEKETGEYIAHRLKVAGGNTGLFSTEAIHEIFTFSKGYPRLINVICDRALLTGFVEETRNIGPKIIRECAAELTIPAPSPAPEHERRKPLPPVEGHEQPLSRPLQPGQPVRGRITPPQPGRDISPSEMAPVVLPRSAPQPPPTPATNGVSWQSIVYPATLLILGILVGMGGVFFFGNQKKTADFLSNVTNSLMGRLVEPNPIPSPSLTQPSPTVPAVPTPVQQAPSTTSGMHEPGEGEVLSPLPAPQAGPPHLMRATGKTPGNTTAQQSRPMSTEALSAPELKSLPDAFPLEQPFTIVFDQESNELPQEIIPLLERFAQTVNHAPAVKEIVLRGYSDNSGSEQDNQQLSNFRAQLIRSFLMGRGITSIPFTIQAMGSKDPTSSNDTPEGRKKNRRVLVRAVRP